MTLSCNSDLKQLPWSRM